MKSNNMSVSKNELQTFFDQEFPQSNAIIDSLGDQTATVRMSPSERDLRPGGTVSGPFMMAVADVSIYAAILGEVGLVALALTTNLNINFLSRPTPERDVVGKCKLIKVGSKLVVGEVTLFSQGLDQPIAHAVGTYSLPKSS